MTLPPNRPPFGDVYLSASTASIGATPVAGVAVSPAAGFIRKVYAAADGTTTGTITIAVSINGGSDITGGLFVIPAGSNPRNGASFDLAKVGVNIANVNEDDVITFTPSGGGGASIPGAFAAAIRPQ